MCRSIKPLFNFDPPATEDEIRAASLQFVRKLSGMTKPSSANQTAFDEAVDEIAGVASRLMASLKPPQPRRIAKSRPNVPALARHPVSPSRPREEGCRSMTVATIEAHDLISDIYQIESRRVFATLVRLLGDFDLAEDALQDAFAAAVTQWPRDGIPENPRAWLVSAGRFKSIDGIRKRARFDASLATLARDLDERMEDEYDLDDADGIGDDRLKLIFTCCNPALSPRRARPRLRRWSPGPDQRRHRRHAGDRRARGREARRQHLHQVRSAADRRQPPAGACRAAPIWE